MAQEVLQLEVARHFATPWLVNEFTLTTDTLNGIVPKLDPVFGFFKTGTNEIALPLRTITSIKTKSRFSLLRLILAIVGISLGGISLLAIVSGDPEVDLVTVAFLVFLPAGVWLGLQVYTAELVIRDDSGGKERVEVSVADRGAARAFADAVSRAAADAAPKDNPQGGGASEFE